MPISFSQTATIIPFPVRAACDNRLSSADRLEILRSRETALQRGFGRMVIQQGEDPEIGDFLSLYRHGESWAAWCIARHGARVRPWRCATGRDLGEFDTIADALAAVFSADLSARSERAEAV